MTEPEPQTFTALSVLAGHPIDGDTLLKVAGHPVPQPAVIEQTDCRTIDGTEFLEVLFWWAGVTTVSLTLQIDTEMTVQPYGGLSDTVGTEASPARQPDPIAPISFRMYDSNRSSCGFGYDF